MTTTRIKRHRLAHYASIATAAMFILSCFGNSLTLVVTLAAAHGIARLLTNHYRRYDIR